MAKCAKIVIFVSGKGGVGKSCLMASVGREMAQLGQKTLLLEFEPGYGSLDLLLNLERGVYSFCDFLTGRCDVCDCLVKPPCEHGLWVGLAPFRDIAGVDSDLLKEKIENLACFYDFIFIEISSGYNPWFGAVASICDMAVLVCTADMVSLRAGREISDKLDVYRNVSQFLIINRLEVHKFLKERPVLHLDFAIDTVGARLLGVVPEDRAFSLFLAKGSPLPEYSEAKSACRNIARRILGQPVALGV